MLTARMIATAAAHTGRRVAMVAVSLWLTEMPTNAHTITAS